MQYAHTSIYTYIYIHSIGLNLIFSFVSPNFNDR